MLVCSEEEPGLFACCCVLLTVDVLCLRFYQVTCNVSEHSVDSPLDIFTEHCLKFSLI